MARDETGSVSYHLSPALPGYEALMIILQIQYRYVDAVRFFLGREGNPPVAGDGHGVFALSISLQRVKILDADAVRNGRYVVEKIHNVNGVGVKFLANQARRAVLKQHFQALVFYLSDRHPLIPPFTSRVIT